MGRDLYPALTALRVWGDKYLADPEGPATDVLHRGCGAPVHTALMCTEGHVVQTDGPRAPARARRPDARRLEFFAAQR